MDHWITRLHTYLFLAVYTKAPEGTLFQEVSAKFTGFETLKVMSTKGIFWDVMCEVHTNVSEERAASIFRTE
jgi:hypothetical protein